MKTIGDILDVLKWEKFKGMGIIAVWAVITFFHSTFYVPHLTEKIKPRLIREIQDSLKTVVLLELRHDAISLNLQLAEELGVPLNKVPQTIGQSVQITDSAKSMQHFIPVLEDIRRIVDIGLKYDRLNKRFFLVTPIGGVGEVHEDIIGLYRHTKNGTKVYLYEY